MASTTSARSWKCYSKDVNECIANTHNCDSNAYCTNTYGGFTCACKSGYSGSGTSCSDLCDLKTCQNGGTCYRGFCRCPPDFFGDSCESGVRLVNGSAKHEGRVELFYQGNWGTICDDDWNIQDADVVCKMLGYPRAIQALPFSAFGEGTGNIVLDKVNCSSGHNIFNCGHHEYLKHNCEHLEDAGVVCDNNDHLVILGGKERRYDISSDV